jgi:hypothetical protein
MAEIYSPQAAQGARKTWLWPVYDAGKVDPVFRVTREIDGKGYYTTPTPEEKERLLGLMSQSRAQTYTSTGGIVSNADVHFRPGTFFDAMA